MKKKIIGFIALAIMTTKTFAGTPVEMVNKIDQAREENLAELVLKNFVQTQSIKCEPNELAKYEIVKISSDSANQEKVPGTAYDYKATYLVIQKCIYGSTFVGAYTEARKTTEMEGSFTSKYNKKGGPLKMQGLKITATKNIEL